MQAIVVSEEARFCNILSKCYSSEWAVCILKLWKWGRKIWPGNKNLDITILWSSHQSRYAREVVRKSLELFDCFLGPDTSVLYWTVCYRMEHTWLHSDISPLSKDCQDQWRQSTLVSYPCLYVFSGWPASPCNILHFFSEFFWQFQDYFQGGLLSSRGTFHDGWGFGG